MKSNTNKKTCLVVMLTTLLWLPLKTFWESRDDFWMVNTDMIDELF